MTHRGSSGDISWCGWLVTWGPPASIDPVAAAAFSCHSALPNQSYFWQARNGGQLLRIFTIIKMSGCPFNMLYSVWPHWIDYMNCIHRLQLLQCVSIWLWNLPTHHHHCLKKAAPVRPPPLSQYTNMSYLPNRRNRKPLLSLHYRSSSNLWKWDFLGKISNLP